MPRTLHARVVKVFDHEYSAAVGLAGGVAIALVWSRLRSASYFTVFTSPLHSPQLAYLGLNSLHDVIVNAMMAIYFFALGLELSRELSSGFLTKVRYAVPAASGAIGGMLATSLGSVLLGAILHSNALRRGWGIPMATDVAFTLGVLAIVGRRLAPALRLFLLSLAITDDVLSVIVLGFTGVSHVRVAGLIAMTVTTLAGFLFIRRVRTGPTSIILFTLLWLSFAWANVEPALAGVLAGILVAPGASTRVHLERNATRISVVVLPLFALAACGLHWTDLHLHGRVETVVVATIALRLVGKTLGITSGVALARVFRFRLPPSMSWPLVTTASLLCAIGFTVPLLFATRLFGAQSALYAGFTVGLLVSSAIAALVGGELLRRWRRAG